MYFFLDFSQKKVYHFKWKIELKSVENEIHGNLISICLCRKNLNEPIYYILPYFGNENEKDEDIVALCGIGKENENGFEKFGIYDDTELYDFLLLKQQEMIPSSIIDPLPYSNNRFHDQEIACFDIDKKPMVLFKWHYCI